MSVEYAAVALIARENAYLNAWFALIDELHYTPKWRKRKRQRIDARIAALEREWDRRA